MKKTPVVSKRDRYEGCLLGLALGDALGAPIEWAKPGFVPITELRASVTHGLALGEWTDDTSMALATAHSLILKGFDTKDQLEQYLQWYRKGKFSANGKCVGIGRTTRESLEMFSKNKKKTTAIQKDPLLAGNGTIMRIAPIAMYARNLTQVQKYSSLNSATTHSNPLCTQSAELFSRMIFIALKGSHTKAEIFRNIELQCLARPHTLRQELRTIFEKKTYKYNPPYIESTGYVIKSLEAALWAFNKSRSFKHGALLAVNLGGDADTVGALYGQLAGAYYGVNAIPTKWQKQIHNHVEIKNIANCLRK